MPPKKPRKEWTRDTSYKTHEGSYAYQMVSHRARRHTGLPFCTPDSAGSPSHQELPEGAGEPKGGKRKVAMTVGYCGTGFQGMQM